MHKFIIALGFTALAHATYAQTDGAAASDANQALKDEVQRLKEENQLRKDLLDSTKELLGAQKGVVDGQKDLAGSQKALIDAMFPAIEGGKSGSLTFTTKEEISVLVQPAASRALMQVGKSVCDAAKTSGANGTAPVGLYVAGDSDLQLALRFRVTHKQLEALSNSYKAKLPADNTGTTQYSMPPGLLLYGAGAIAKQLSGFLKLFWSDREVMMATVVVDERSLHDAVAACTAPIQTKTLESGVAEYVVFPSKSSLFNILSTLSAQRYTAERRMAALKGLKDEAAAADRTALETLNTQYDSTLTTLLSAEDPQKAPALVSLLAGESLAQALSDDFRIVSTRVVKSGGVGMKKSSLWFPDRLYAGSSITISYRVVDKAGNVSTSGLLSAPMNFERVKLD